MQTTEALKWLRDLRAALCRPCGSALSEERKAFMEAVDVAVDAQDRDGWISVEKRLPDEAGSYLVVVHQDADSENTDGYSLVLYAWYSMKPILFNTEMVRAILDGRKTQTRRVCKGQPQDGVTSPEALGYKSPYQPGDILYVREAYDELPVKPDCSWSGGKTYLYYRADGDLRPEIWRGNWKPSIHMPKGAARLFLRVTDVRAERLQHITRGGAISEGCNAAMPILEFQGLWDSTIKPADRERYGWAANPWVWVIEFERCEEPDDCCSH